MGAQEGTLSNENCRPGCEHSPLDLLRVSHAVATDKIVAEFVGELDTDGITGFCDEASQKRSDTGQEGIKLACCLLRILGDACTLFSG